MIFLFTLNDVIVVFSTVLVSKLILPLLTGGLKMTLGSLPVRIFAPIVG